MEQTRGNGAATPVRAPQSENKSQDDSSPGTAARSAEIEHQQDAIKSEAAPTGTPYTASELSSRCIASAGTDLRRLLGLDATAWRAFPLQLENGEKPANARTIELDTVNTGQKMTYVFMCVSTPDGGIGTTPQGHK